MRVYTSVMTEDALVNRLKQNSQSAFEELVKNYGRRLYMASFRIVGNSDDAEDAVQQTFLRVLESVYQFSFWHRVSGWPIVEALD